MKKIRTLLFDLGGVLIEVDPDRGLSLLQTQMHPSVSKRRLHHVLYNADLLERYERGKIDSESFYREVQKQLRQSISFNAFRNAWQGIFRPNRPMIEFLKRMKKEYQLVLISNTNELHMECILKRFAFMKDFDCCIYSYRTGYVKPEKEIYLAALRICGAEAGSSLFIDDSASNIEGAQRLGIRSLHFTGNNEFLSLWESSDFHSLNGA